MIVQYRLPLQIVWLFVFYLQNLHTSVSVSTPARLKSVKFQTNCSILSSILHSCDKNLDMNARQSENFNSDLIDVVNRAAAIEK